MSVAVITFVYNESVNLPIWLRHYGRNFGEGNLFIVDHGSNDGSTAQIGQANLIRIPRTPLDEIDRTNFVNHLHASLLNFYDVVIYSDCDEMLVPDPDKYESLQHYVEHMENDHVNAIGIDVIHMINLEQPIDLSNPILSQRRFGRFLSPASKKLISKTEIRWLPGFHCSDKRPVFDESLFVFHLKSMDYNVFAKRHKINSQNEWSERSLSNRHGGHHRYDQNKIFHELFLVPIDLHSRGQVFDFKFDEEIELTKARTQHHDGFYHIPMDISKLVRIPERFSQCL